MMNNTLHTLAALLLALASATAEAQSPVVKTDAGAAR